MKSARLIALVAGFGFLFLALAVQGIFPYVMKGPKPEGVISTVRTELGELAEISSSARPYTTREMQGRAIYIREGCWYCHSMYLRPVAGEDRRWGPVAEFGEYVHDIPHLFGTRRIGPDLTRIGGKYGDDWHAAHYFNPRMVVPDSVMPRFTWLFTRDASIGKQVLTDEGKALVAFVQNIGMSKGKWRDAFASQILAAGVSSIQTTGTPASGKTVYLRRCVGCHGEKGDGKGAAPSSVLFGAAQPRDFTSGVFKFRTTPSGSVPLDTDLFRTISVGIRGSAMPPWFNLPEEERRDVVQYIKTFSHDFEEYPPGPPIEIPRAPKPTPDLISRGRKVYEEMQCKECHGAEGRGDGPSATTLKDDFGNSISPANFTTGVFKSGPRPEDIFRTFMTGLNGTPMPSFKDAFASPDDGWAITYYVLSLSADRGR